MGRNVSIGGDVSSPSIKVDLAPPFKEMVNSYVETEIAQNDSISLNFTITQNGTAFNLTGYSIVYRAKVAFADAAYVINETATITDAANGKCSVSLSATDTATAQSLNSQLFVGLNGATLTAYRGLLTIIPSV